MVRDRWGVIRSRNEAFNQYNELVMSFTIDILAERSPAGGSPAERSPGSGDSQSA